MSVKRLHHECISCMTKIHLEKCPKELSDDKKVEYMQFRYCRNLDGRNQ